MTDLRRQARGRGCQIRLPDVCNHNSETVVLAHLRMTGISGYGLKAPDVLGSWACSACHAYVDSHHDIETNAAFYEGIMRTINILWREGVLRT